MLCIILNSGEKQMKPLKMPGAEKSSSDLIQGGIDSLDLD